ncbi:MAG TPA: acyl-CoA reductase, partial [Candidatus Methylomirabilis sp.]
AEDALPAITGYSPPTIREGLSALLHGLRRESLLQCLTAEFGDPASLDAFRPLRGTGLLTRAFGPRLAVHVFSGNVPGLPVWSLTCGLLVKAANLGKTASGEPLLPALFAASLAEVDPDLARCLAILYWPGGAEDLEAAAFGRAGAVIAYGSDEALRSLRARVPAAARFLAYSHRLSFGVIAREVLTAAGAAEVAARAAVDVATFDQQGCVSPHVFYVETGGEVSPRDLAAALAAALQEVERRLPRGRVPLGASAAIQALRDMADLRGAEVWASPGGTAWTVIFEEDATFAPSCLNRTVRVKPVADLADLPPLLAPLGNALQTAGVAAPPERLPALAARLGRLGVTRLCPLGQMPYPAFAWHHDGRGNLLDLVRFTDIEPGAEA